MVNLLGVHGWGTVKLGSSRGALQVNRDARDGDSLAIFRRHPLVLSCYSFPGVSLDPLPNKIKRLLMTPSACFVII